MIKHRTFKRWGCLLKGLVFLLGLFVVFKIWVFISNNYHTITVDVMDAETSEPIEGAVLLAQWTKTAMTVERSSVNFKVIEVLSDEKGQFTIPGFYESGVDKPRLVVYKKGYVAWRDDFKFMDYKNRKKPFRWRSGNVVELERFKIPRSRDIINNHHSFITGGYGSGVPSDGVFKKALFGEL